MRLYTKLLLGLILGAGFAVAARALNAAPVLSFFIAIEPLGLVFIRLITMVVVPLIVGSLFVACASLGSVRRLAGRGGRTLAYFLTTTVIAACTGLVVALLIRPGEGADIQTPAAAAASGSSAAAEKGLASLPQMLLEMIPLNPFGAAANMDLLPLVLAVVIFG